MLRLLLAVTFGFMSVWHPPAMALSKLSSPTSHHGGMHGTADHTHHAPHHAPKPQSDALAPCPALFCCMCVTPAPSLAKIAAVPSKPFIAAPARLLADAGPSPPVPPPRLPA